MGDAEHFGQPGVADTLAVQRADAADGVGGQLRVGVRLAGDRRARQRETRPPAFVMAAAQPFGVVRVAAAVDGAVLVFVLRRAEQRGGIGSAVAPP
jgi:hypothetical protein